MLGEGGQQLWLVVDRLDPGGFALNSGASGGRADTRSCLEAVASPLGFEPIPSKQQKAFV
jgi:hypothetical protein